jgi:CheY-like chemotaxis protein
VEEENRVHCAFDIIDTGIGMFPEELDKIFNQFEQANTHIAKHYGGTGLGLTIVKSLIDAQNGTLEVSSKPGYGSTFQIGLSYEICSPARAEEKQSLEPDVSSAFAGKVMMVDDDPLILRLCSLILTKNKIEHMTFQDPEQCVAQPVDEKVTHVFLDIRMPSINGVDLCHQLQEKYPEGTHFIALTAHVLKEERESILAEGFDAILSKPFHESELLEVLRKRPVKDPVVVRSPDLSALRQMTLNDEQLFQSVLSQFVEETTDDMHTLNTVLPTRDAKQVREVVHRLSGRLSQIGITTLGSQLHEIESEIVGGKKIEELSETLATILRSLDRLIVELRSTTLEHSN